MNKYEARLSENLAEDRMREAKKFGKYFVAFSLGFLVCAFSLSPTPVGENVYRSDIVTITGSLQLILPSSLPVTGAN